MCADQGTLGVKVSDVVETLIGDKVVEWFTEGHLPDQLPNNHIWVKCGNDPNEAGEYPHCVVELPDINEMCALVKHLQSAEILIVVDDDISLEIDEDQAAEQDFRHRDILLLVVLSHADVLRQLSQAVYWNRNSTPN